MDGDRLLVSEHNHLITSSIAFGQNEERSINISNLDAAQGSQERSDEGNLVSGKCNHRVVLQWGVS